MKKHSSRPVGGVETDKALERTLSKGAAGRHRTWWIVEQGGQKYSWATRQQLVDLVTDLTTQSSQHGEIKPQTTE